MTSPINSEARERAIASIDFRTDGDKIKSVRDIIDAYEAALREAGVPSPVGWQSTAPKDDIAGLVKRLRDFGNPNGHGPAGDVMRQAATALEDMGRENERLREALEPFSRAAAAVDFYQDGRELPPDLKCDGEMAIGEASWENQQPTVEDCRRARTALQAKE